MQECMRRVARCESEMTVEERNLFSAAYKNVTAARRSSLRTVATMELQAREQQSDARRLALLTDLRLRIERELRERCAELLLIVDKNLIPLAGSTEARVFYYKLYASSL